MLQQPGDTLTIAIAVVNALIKVNLTRAIRIHLCHRTIDVLVSHFLVTCKAFLCQQLARSETGNRQMADQ